MNPISVNELTESVNSNLPRDIKSTIAKNILAEEKDSDVAKNIFSELINDLSSKTQREVVNATGTVLHTNLGRSPNNISFSGSYTNIEYDLKTLSRGKRNEYLSVLMNNLIGSKDIAFVNNNASSLFLSLKAISKSHNIQNVIISRGEIIEIGGSYRLPEIINETGLNLVEIGTTNKTKLSDYRKALEKYPNSLILKVHRSNFSINGFTEDVSIEELAELKNKFDVFLFHDLGSGLVIDKKFLEINNISIFKDEPFVQDSLSDGANLVMFSGDKLFGSVQSGMIAGDDDLVNEIKNYSLFRTYRCSPMTLFELQETVLKYINKQEKEIPFWNLITQPYSSLEDRCKNIAKSISFSTSIEKGESVIGGGTLPDVTLESPILLINNEKTVDTVNQLIKNDIPIVPRIIKDQVCLDLRSVFHNQDDIIVQALNNS
ncbi:MAG: L-seryl-tRNA(Sec) selenium transferase [Actinomycetota bacterium]|nr:L-seryl-tRNA(Sec) selenium transferase [bacterium]GIR14964.1 MAG: L-seryl-tRNA(Sec) selenium transferase [Actinomycetota bacterium]